MDACILKSFITRYVLIAQQSHVSVCKLQQRTMNRKVRTLLIYPLAATGLKSAYCRKSRNVRGQ